MVVYAAGTAGLAVARPADPRQDAAQQSGATSPFTAWAIVGVYLLKGIGSYVSSYLMADVGQRVVMDLRNALYRHILGQSAGFFAQRTTGQLMSRISNDVGQVQQAVSETIGDLARESLTLVGYAALTVLPRRAADDRLHDRRAARRLSAHPARPARAADDAAQPGGARAALAHQRRGVHRPSHRQGVRHRGARERRSSARAGYQPVPHEHEGHGGAVEPAAADGTARRRSGMAAALWYGAQQIAERPADDRRVRVVLRRCCS